MNIHLPASLVFTKIAGFWPFSPIPNPFLGTISAVACHVVVGDVPADDFWMKWAFCLNFLIIVCSTPYISWIIMIHELGIPIIWVFHCFFPRCSIIVVVQTTCKQLNQLSWDKSRPRIYLNWRDVATGNLKQGDEVEFLLCIEVPFCIPNLKRQSSIVIQIPKRLHQPPDRAGTAHCFWGLGINIWKRIPEFDRNMRNI